MPAWACQKATSVDQSPTQSCCSQSYLSLIMLLATARRSADAGAFLLDWRAWQRAIRAKHGAITALRPQHLTASLAGIEANACIGWHRLGCLVTAVRTGDGRAKLQFERLLSHELPNHHHFRRSATRYRASSVS